MASHNAPHSQMPFGGVGGFVKATSLISTICYLCLTKGQGSFSPLLKCNKGSSPMGPPLPFNHTPLLPHHLLSPFYLLITCFSSPVFLSLSSLRPHGSYTSTAKPSSQGRWEFKEGSSMQPVISTLSFFFEKSPSYSCSHQQPQARLSSVCKVCDFNISVSAL